MRGRLSANGQTTYGTRLTVETARTAGSKNIRYTEYPVGMIGAKYGSPHAACEEALRDGEARDWLFAQKKAAAAPTDDERCADATSAMGREIIFDGNGRALPYRKFVPARKRGERYPLMLYLHGMSARGQDNETHIFMPGTALLYALPEHQSENPCYILAPQCPEKAKWWDPGMAELLKQLVEETIAHDYVDPLRVYVTGSSMGGIMAWRMAARYPNLFAAAMPVSGSSSVEDASRLGQLPVWAFHAADDDIVQAAGEMPNPPAPAVYGSRLAVAAARAAGSLHIRYTEYPAGMIGKKWGDVHCAWHEAYRDDNARRWLFRQTRAERYEHKSVAPGLWAVEDWMGDSFYVVDGGDRALVIDTGMASGDIRDVVRRLTPRPYALALTHGHGDHSWHASLFEKVYLSMKDADMLYASRFPGQVSPDESALADLKDMDEIGLGGGIAIKTVALPGHTPGSLLFVDEAHKCVFTGDAVGSGAGVWMQVPTGAPLSAYAQSIRIAKEKLLKLGVEEAGWAFFGGHDSQKHLSAVCGYNPVSFELMDDLVALCEKLLSSEITGSEDTGLPPDMASRFGHTRKATYGKAEMLYRPEQLR